MTDEQTRQLAAEFRQMLLWHMPHDQYLAAVRANERERNPSICHTHDYIDSNMSMLAAFENVLGRTPDASSGTDCALMNQAWDLWRQDPFDFAERRHLYGGPCSCLHCSLKGKGGNDGKART